MSISTLSDVVPGTRSSAQQQTVPRCVVDDERPALANTPRALAGTPAGVRYTTRSAPAVKIEPAEAQAPRSAVYEHGAKGASLAERVAAALEAPSEFPSLATVERDYPHLVTKISAAWSSPVQFTRLMSDLLLADRGGRQGFAPDAAVELTRLRDYYERQRAGTGAGRPGRAGPSAERNPAGGLNPRAA